MWRLLYLFYLEVILNQVLRKECSEKVMFESDHKGGELDRHLKRLGESIAGRSDS